MFANAHVFALKLSEIGKVGAALRSLVTSIAIRSDGMAIILKPDILGLASESHLNWTLPVPARRPSREARLRIDSEINTDRAPTDLLNLIADAMAAQRHVLASPELSLAQLTGQAGTPHRHGCLSSRSIQQSKMKPGFRGQIIRLSSGKIVGARECLWLCRDFASP